MLDIICPNFFCNCHQNGMNGNRNRMETETRPEEKKKMENLKQGKIEISVGQEIFHPNQSVWSWVSSIGRIFPPSSGREKDRKLYKTSIIKHRNYEVWIEMKVHVLSSVYGSAK